MSSLTCTPNRSDRISQAPRATLTIQLDIGEDGSLSEEELTAIQRSVMRGVERIARALNDRAGGGRSPAFLKDLSVLVPMAIDVDRSMISFEAPHDTEQFPIDFGKGDAGVQATELFVHSIGALLDGRDLSEAIGDPASRSVHRFMRSVDAHHAVQVVASVGETETAIEFDPAEAPKGERRRSATSLSFVGRLYGANLGTRTFRFKDELGRTRLVTVGEDLDEIALARELLGDIAYVDANASDEDSSRFIASAIQRVDPLVASQYEAWDAGTALTGHETRDVVEELQIPGLGIEGGS
ncbi:MAG: hypothetical protein M3092_02560 [Actinomycetia bacterium]|nr:hypothetical protein [Actinomycetes bacterium]